jgi:hypothetical protein
MRTFLTERRQVMQQEIRRFRLTGTAFAANDDTLILLLLEHAMISCIGYGKYMRRYVRPQSPVLIQFHIFWIVDGIEFKWIQGDQYAANVSIYVASQKPSPQIVQERLLIEIWKLTQIWVFLITRLIEESIKIVLQKLGIHGKPTVGP